MAAPTVHDYAIATKAATLKTLRAICTAVDEPTPPTLSPSGGDDRVALQAAIDACELAGTDFIGDGSYLLSSPGVEWKCSTRSLNPNAPFTIAPHSSWAPAVSSANDRTVALTTVASTIAGAGTTLSAAMPSGRQYIKVADASLLDIEAGDWIRIYSARLTGGEIAGDNGSERYDLCQVAPEYVAGNTIFLTDALRCFHASGAVVRKVTTARFGLSLRGMRLDASGGSMPVLLRVESVLQLDLDIEVRGASHGAVLAEFGCAEWSGTIWHDGEVNCALLWKASHGSPELSVISTGRGKRYHRNGIIRPLVYFTERCVTPTFRELFLRNGCTGVYIRGTVCARIHNFDIDGMDAAERFRRPQSWLFLPTAASDLITLFRSQVGDNPEHVELGRLMLKSSTTYPAGLAGQTVYTCKNVTATTSQLSIGQDGSVIDIGAGGGSFGEMYCGRYMIEVLVPGNGVITCAGHDFVDGDMLRAVAPSGHSVPTGMGSVDLFVRDAVAGVSFKVSLTQGGAALALGAAGTGFTSVERKRAWDPDTISRTGMVYTGAAGIEINGGNPSYPSEQGRNYGLVIENGRMNNCRVPDADGNQGSYFQVDTFSLVSRNVSITNRGRTEALASPPPEGHCFGALFWDTYQSVFTAWMFEGVERPISVVGGWNLQQWNGLMVNGNDGASSAGTFLVNGMESAAVGPPGLDVLFNDCNLAGYSVMVTPHLSSWFAATDYSWSGIRWKELTILGLLDRKHTWTDVRVAKNLTAGTLAQGDVVKIGQFTGAGVSAGTLNISAVVTTTTDPEVCGVCAYDVLGWAANAYALVALGDGVGTCETAGAVAIGAKLYVQAAASAKLTTVDTLAPAYAIALQGKAALAAGAVAYRRL